MRVLYATTREIAEVLRVVERDRLTDVVVKAPFLGNTAIWCDSERSHDLLRASVASLTSRGPG